MQKLDKVEFWYICLLFNASLTNDNIFELKIVESIFNLH